ncbi:pI243L [African swine fever virus]|uniref:PI243L n=1 Tax=African swine fever virus TaxID=10497 RepID=A0A894KTS6_ASF|nr:pI243L [African swine fever virus]
MTNKLMPAFFTGTKYRGRLIEGACLYFSVRTHTLLAVGALISVVLSFRRLFAANVQYFLSSPLWRQRGKARRTSCYQLPPVLPRQKLPYYGHRYPAAGVFFFRNYYYVCSSHNGLYILLQRFFLAAGTYIVITRPRFFARIRCIYQYVPYKTYVFAAFYKTSFGCYHAFPKYYTVLLFWNLSYLRRWYYSYSYNLLQMAYYIVYIFYACQPVQNILVQSYLYGYYFANAYLPKIRYNRGLYAF